MNAFSFGSIPAPARRLGPEEILARGVPVCRALALASFADVSTIVEFL
jgi:hypothetical protein